MNSDERNLLILSGPSGSGKDSILHRLMELCPGLEQSVSATTRAPRAEERDGVDYHFISRGTFDLLVSRGRFLEHTEYVGNCYGTLRGEVDRRISAGRPVVLVIEVEGAANIKRIYPGATAVFILPPSMEELERRLRGRGTESEERLQARLARAKEEMLCAHDYDYQLVNDDLGRCAQQVLDIFNKNRAGA